MEQGAEIFAYDRVGADNFKNKYPEGKIGKGSIRYVDNIGEALVDTNVCFIFTQWREIKAVKSADYQKLMRIPLVYDCRNIYSIEDMKKAGVELFYWQTLCEK